MRLRSPTSRASFRVRLSVHDAAWAAVSPLLSLAIREAQIWSQGSYVDTAFYCLLSFICSMLAFSVFRIQDGMTRYFSVRDAVNIVKAVFLSELVTCIVLFSFTRLEGIPRSTPFIHFFILTAGLVGGRTLARLFEAERVVMARRGGDAIEQIIMIGSNRLSLLYLKFMDAYTPVARRVVAILDDRPQMIGRAMEGVRIVGPTQHLEPMINEFAEHGVPIHRVIVGAEPESMPDDQLKEVARICEEHEIQLDFVPELIGLNRSAIPRQTAIEDDIDAAAATSATVFVVPHYFRVKRFIDFFASLALMIVLSPLWALVAVVAYFDVGSPILFWQQRAGRGGRPFLLQKVRTLQPPFDWRGQAVPQAKRVSWIGQLLRKTHLDEFPQLLHILVGDMSLIGPRPLLPRDQPENPSIRLMVRPGITGWAQVNGGTLLTPSEKEALDEWYIRNGTLWLDLRILVRTLYVAFKGYQRCEEALASARALQANAREAKDKTASRALEAEVRAAEKYSSKLMHGPAE